MSDSIRDRLRDELTGWPIGSGYYSTTVSVDDARDMADAVLKVLADLPVEALEKVAEVITRTWPPGYGEAVDIASVVLQVIGEDDDE